MANDGSPKKVSRRDVLRSGGAALSLLALDFSLPLKALAATSLGDGLGRKALRGNKELILGKNVRVGHAIFNVEEGAIELLVFSKEGESSQSFFIPHDNEVAAFDSALRYIAEHGGRLVTFDSRGSRNLRTSQGATNQDPNRMFTEGSRYWPLAERVVKMLAPQENAGQIITLHNNAPMGSFALTVTTPPKGITLFTVESGRRRDTVWLSGSSQVPDRLAGDTIAALNKRGINCVYECIANAKPDGSLSQFAAARGARYFNLEAGLDGLSDAHIEKTRERQQRMLTDLMEILTAHSA